MSTITVDNDSLNTFINSCLNSSDICLSRTEFPEKDLVPQERKIRGGEEERDKKGKRAVLAWAGERGRARGAVALGEVLEEPQAQRTEGVAPALETRDVAAAERHELPVHGRQGAARSQAALGAVLPPQPAPVPPQHRLVRRQGGAMVKW